MLKWNYDYRWILETFNSTLNWQWACEIILFKWMLKSNCNPKLMQPSNQVLLNSSSCFQRRRVILFIRFFSRCTDCRHEKFFVWTFLGTHFVNEFVRGLKLQDLLYFIRNADYSTWFELIWVYRNLCLSWKNEKMFLVDECFRMRNSVACYSEHSLCSLIGRVREPLKLHKRKLPTISMVNVEFCAWMIDCLITWSDTY